MLCGLPWDRPSILIPGPVVSLPERAPAPLFRLIQGFSFWGGFRVTKVSSLFCTGPAPSGDSRGIFEARSAPSPVLGPDITIRF